MKDDQVTEPPTDTPVARFFDTLTSEYDATIERCFPRYREMLWALLYYLPRDSFHEILELGCGTGNLTSLLCERFPDASLRVVDVSGESLDVCRHRLGESSRIHYEQRDFRALEFEPERFDLIVSSISIHHLTADEKRRLFCDSYRWLRPSGIFTFSDQCAGSVPEVNKLHVDAWKQVSRAAGSTQDEWEMWMEHQAQHDHHDSLPDQMRWLREAGYADVDCTWRYLLWSVVQAIK